MSIIPLRIAEPTVTEAANVRAASAASWALGVAAITLMAAVIRTVGIERHSFWYDEAITAQLIRSGSWLDLLLGRVRDNGNPPLYWLLVKPWAALFGDGEVALRSLSVAFSTAAVPLMALLARRLFDARVGIVAAILLAISPLSLELANEARSYALLQFLSVAATLSLLRWLDERRWADLGLYTLAMASACLTHYYAIFLPLAHGLAVIATREGRRRFPAWVEAMVIAAVIGMFWVGAFIEQMRTPDNLSRMGDRWPLQFFGTPVTFAFGRTLAWRDSSKWFLGVATLAALALFVVPAVRALWSMRVDRRAVVLLGSWAFLPVGLPLLAALIGTPMYHVRAGSVALPALLILTAAGICAIAGWRQLLACGAILALTGVSFANYLEKPLKDDWRSATPVILAHLSAADAVLFDTSIEAASFGYYARRAGGMPAETIGITQPAAGGRIVGVKFVNGEQSERVPRDYTDEVFAKPSITVATCVPHSTGDAYQRFFESYGYRLVANHSFHRVDVYRFEKRGN